MFHLTPARLAVPTVSLCVTAAALAATRPALNTSRGQLAVHGYDVMAYWQEARPVRGRQEFEHRWNGGVWRFASARNRDRFAAAPERFAPQFGSYCAYAVSQGYTAGVNSAVWRIVDGRLYLNYSRDAQRLWEADLTANIMRGHRNWPGVLER